MLGDAAEGGLVIDKVNDPAYGRQKIARLMRIVGMIQVWRGFVIYF